MTSGTGYHHGDLPNALRCAAVDVIDDVGPIPGQFLGHAHTRELWKEDGSFLQVTDHLPYSEWVMTGKKDMLDLARQRVEEILESHQPMPLTQAEESALEDILEEARNRYRAQGVIDDDEWRRYMEELSR